MDPYTMAQQLFEVFSWGDDWMPGIEPWLASCHASTLLRGLDSHTALLKLSKEEELCLLFLFDENLRRNVFSWGDDWMQPVSICRRNSTN
jgi:hypothetical protein